MITGQALVRRARNAPCMALARGGGRCRGRFESCCLFAGQLTGVSRKVAWQALQVALRRSLAARTSVMFSSWAALLTT